MASPTRLTLGAFIAAASVLGAQAQAPPVGRVTGRVVTPHAELVADATVTLARGPGLFAAVQTTSSGTDGQFSFEDLPPGRYRVSAAKLGYTSRRSEVSAGSLLFFEVGPQFDLADGHGVHEVEILLYREASIAGRILGPDGTPAAGARVTAGRRHPGGYTQLVETQTASEWDGRYRISSLPPGEYVVTADGGPESLGSGPVLLTRTLFPGVVSLERGDTVTVFEGIPVEGIDIWLAPARRFGVAGRVHWPADVTVEHVAIEYGPAGTQAGLWLVSDPDGLFALTDAPPGSLILLARADSSAGPLAGLTSTQVSVDGVEDVAIVLQPPGSVQGRVVYDADVPVSARPGRLALAQTLIRVSPLYPAPEAPISPDGRFELDGALGEFEFRLVDGAGLAISSVRRNGQPVAGNRIRIAGDEQVTGIEVFVGR